MIPISIFNGNVLDITLVVNNGPQFAIPSALGPTFTPQTAPSGGPTWSYDIPAPGTLAPGNNYLSLTPTGMTQAETFVVSLPETVQWASLQLYLFFGNVQDLGWVALNNGQYVAGSIPLNSSSLGAQAPATAPSVQTTYGENA